jgi:hypothetical protein
MEEIPDRVFAGREDVSVCHEGDLRRGQEEVRRYYREAENRVREMGGFLRVDMPASLYIEPGTDGEKAVGHCLAMSKQILKKDGESFYRTLIGRYTNAFVLEKGIWKIQSIHYESLCEFEGTKETSDPNLEQYRQNPTDWVRELPELVPLSDEGVTKRTERTLALRNEIFSWIFRMNCGEQIAVPCATGEAEEAVSKLCSGARFFLATSPVIRMREDTEGAEAFLSAAVFDEREPGFLIYRRGSIHMTLSDGGDGWKADGFGWYPYASLEPLAVKRMKKV